MKMAPTLEEKSSIAGKKEGKHVYVGTSFALFVGNLRRKNLRNKKIDSMKVPDWQLLLIKLEIPISDEGWQKKIESNSSRKKEDSWPKPPDVTIAVKDNDPEVKEEMKAVSFAASCGINPIDRMIHYFSSWYRLKKHFAWILRYREKTKILSTIRAIHLEVLHSMATDSFVNSLMRFIARRGKPESIRSDNGTNFVAGNKEIAQAIEQWNSQRISEFLLQRQIKWLFNPPAASHQGAVWERCIRTFRKVLDAVTKEVLDDEGFSTLFCEVERIINSRPITKTSDDPKDLEPLTPNHILLLRSELSLPPGVFTNDDVYSKRKWKQVQYLADLFWRRWIQEYLPTLQRRQKWLRPSRNFSANDIMLVVDDRLPRSSCPLGRVMGVRKNLRDGLVRSVTVKTKIVLLEAVEVTDHAT
ncbi:hypothetical protein AC249_AIPGENE13494 [Exaiptasia diaphana]|nr:hypothetical protein AC249_AIPGENE13494 [Exaiptasia diaphana]